MEPRSLKTRTIPRTNPTGKAFGEGVLLRVLGERKSERTVICKISKAYRRMHVNVL